MSYDVLAAFYDKLNRSIDYGAWAREIKGFLDKKGFASDARLIDIACGTGKMTLELSRLGYSVAGADLSPEMLAVAQSSCARENFYPLLVCQDMTCLELAETFDCAVCCLDSVNYIKGADALDGFFARVRDHLSRGGYFFFDVNTKYKFENIYGDNSYVYDEKDVFCVWQNFYSERRALCDFDLTFFVKNADGSYKRLHETQREYVYTDSEICTLLEKNSFEVELVSADHDFALGGGRRVTDADERHYFIAKRI